MRRLPFLFAIALAACMLPAVAFADSGTQMHRLYNPNSGEHFYTASASERDDVVAAGWIYEGIGWTAPTTGDPVYRLYNSYAGDHHYTLSAQERDELMTAGWTNEDIGWYSDPNEWVPLFREYNPNEFSCNHNYTADKGEHDYLVSLGWADEGIAWYGISALDYVVDYADGVTTVAASKADVSEDGNSATISGDALSGAPSKGDIVVVADDKMQGTAIKVDSAVVNDDGSYTLSGTTPEFGEVFDELELNGEEKLDGAKITYLAPGVEITGGLAPQNSLAVQGLSVGDTIYGDTFSFTIGQEFFKFDKLEDVEIAMDGNLEVSVTPSVEYELEYEWLQGFKKAKALVHMEESIKGTVNASGEVKIPVPCATIELGVARFDVYVVIGAEGALGITLEEADASFGVDWRAGSADSPFVYSYEDKGVSATFELEGRIGVGAEAEVGVLNFDVANVYGEAGGKASVTLNRRSPVLMCEDYAAWVYAEVGVSVMKEIADIGKFDAEIVQEVWSPNKGALFMPPLSITQHRENGVEVAECTWGLQSHHYEIVRECMNWDEAKAACEKRGGHLATITSAAEQETIEKLNTSNARLWIGGFRTSGTTNDWQWVTGERWDYENWASGEPNNSRNVITNETKVAVWPKTWNDLNNASREQGGYICEWDDDASWAARDKGSDLVAVSYTQGWLDIAA